MLLNKIKKDQLLSRKKGDEPTTKLLTTLIGEAEKIGKDNGNRETNDEETIAVIKKFIKGINENITHVGETSALTFELVLLNSYLPMQLSEDMIRNLVESYATENDFNIKDMGKVMGLMKQNHAGLYDGAITSRIVREILGKR